MPKTDTYVAVLTPKLFWETVAPGRQPKGARPDLLDADRFEVFVRDVEREAPGDSGLIYVDIPSQRFTIPPGVLRWGAEYEWGVATSSPDGLSTVSEFARFRTPASPADVSTTDAAPGDDGYGIPDGAVDESDERWFRSLWQQAQTDPESVPVLDRDRLDLAGGPPPEINADEEPERLFEIPPEEMEPIVDPWPLAPDGRIDQKDLDRFTEIYEDSKTD